MKYVKLFEEFLNEHAIRDNLKKNEILILYHLSTIKYLRRENYSIHLGTKIQALDRLDDLQNENKNSPIYLHAVKIKLENPCPDVLEDIDDDIPHQQKEDFLKHGNYNEFAYVNQAEGTEYSWLEFDRKKDLDNLSLYIVDFSKSVIKTRIINTIQ